MSFAWHHPSYYKKLKQNSRRSYGIGSSKDTVSEDLSPQTMETEKVGHVDRLSLVPHQPNLSSIHTDQKETKQ